MTIIIDHKVINDEWFTWDCPIAVPAQGSAVRTLNGLENLESRFGSYDSERLLSTPKAFPFHWPQPFSVAHCLPTQRLGSPIFDHPAQITQIDQMEFKVWRLISSAAYRVMRSSDSQPTMLSKQCLPMPNSIRQSQANSKLHPNC